MRAYLEFTVILVLGQVLLSVIASKINENWGLAISLIEMFYCFAYGLLARHISEKTMLLWVGSSLLIFVFFEGWLVIAILFHFLQPETYQSFQNLYKDVAIFIWCMNSFLFPFLKK